MAYDESEKQRYQPTKEETEARSKVYKHLQTMRELKDKKMPHFSGPDGERSWLQLVDDSERVLNGYTLSREAQNKEPWQSNLLDKISRAKMRAVAAGVGLKVPDMAFSATDQDGVLSPYRAEIAKQVTKRSFEDGNPSLHSFKEVWHMLSHGVIFEYEGFKTGGAIRERIVSFDTQTGEVETKKEYVPAAGKPFSVILNPQEFYWWTFYVEDIQDQPRIAWVQHYTKAQCEQEFGRYKNYKYLKDKAGTDTSEQSTLYFEEWSGRVEEENDFEVVRMYSKEDNGAASDLFGYEVWVNGVPMLRCPLLWGGKEAMYPFSKQIAEPYANTNFFVGMTFGQLMEGYQETKNTVINTMVDKLYRSMTPPYLVGLANKDLLEYEGQFVNQDNRFYVPDVEKVKPFPYQGVNQGELAMVALLDRGVENVSVDRAQQGQVAAGGGKTAREVVIADQRAQELKGALFLALEDLWYQKTRLRLETILVHYLADKASQKYIKDQIISVPDYIFADGTRGVLALHVAKNPAKQLSRLEIEAREAAMEVEGVPYKVVSITQDYLDEHELDFRVMPQSIADKDRARDEGALMDEVSRLSLLYPEFVAANKDRYLAEILGLRGKHPSEFNPPAQLPAMAPMVPGMPEDAPASAAAPTPVLGLT